MTNPTTLSRLSNEFDLASFVRLIIRRKLFLITFVFICSLISVVVVLQLDSRYTANTLVMIETRGAKIVELENVVPSLAVSSAAMETQTQILKSRFLVRKVVEQLGLLGDPKFNPALEPEATGFLRYLGLALGAVSRTIKKLLKPRPVDVSDELNNYESINQNRELETVIDKLLSRLTVSPLPGSFIISVAYVSEYPAKAALIANTLSELYLVDQLEAKYEATRRATAWLSERLVGLRRDTNDAERIVEAYRESAGLVGGEDVTVKDKQLSEVNAQLISARAERAALVTRLAQLKRLLAEPGAIDSAPEVLASQVIVELKQQESQLLRREAELSNTFRELHPVMINARAELRDLRKKIAVETKRIVKGLANEVEVAHVRENAISTSLDSLRRQVAQLDKAEVKLRELQRLADASRVLYETFLSRFKETSQQEKLQEPDARVISTASVPIRPSFPRKTHLVILVAGVSIFLGILIILVLEKLDNGFRSAEQIEGMSGVRVIGVVPTIRGFSLIRKFLHRSILDRPDRAFDESIRTVNTAIALLSAASPSKIVLVVSSVPGEGKTTIAASMALQMAKSGKKCLLLDCDLRRSQLSKLLGISKNRAITDFLLGQKSLDEVVHRDEETGLDILVANSALFDGQQLKNLLPSIFGPEELATLLQSLSSQYDHIVIDSPPVMVVSDAHKLSLHVDKLIYVVQWGSTRRNVVLSGLKRLKDGGAEVAGIVLSRVNARKYALYGFADAGIYSDEYHKYY